MHSRVAEVVLPGNPHEIHRQSKVRNSDFHGCGERIRLTSALVYVGAGLDVEKTPDIENPISPSSAHIGSCLWNWARDIRAGSVNWIPRACYRIGP